MEDCRLVVVNSCHYPRPVNAPSAGATDIALVVVVVAIDDTNDCRQHGHCRCLLLFRKSHDMMQSS
jgi:hypothetical protein